METIYIDSAIRPKETRTTGWAAVATIGFFDGVHYGHRTLLEVLRGKAKENGLRSMVITFADHPRRVVHSDWQPLLLTTLEEKRRLIEETGIDVLVVLRFDETMAQLSAREFMLRVLKEQLNVSMLLTGYDNRFGHDRRESFDDYVRYGQEMGINVCVGPKLSIDDSAVSSSRIRRLLAEGEVASAAACLGRRYTLTGRVIHGEQIGSQMGFPTANLKPDDAQKLVPKDGVYAVTATMEGGNETLQGVMNIGTRPTFDGHRHSLEVHLFEFSGDIYGQKMSISFVDRLRDERLFTSAEELAHQMVQDKQAAQSLFASTKD